MAKHNIWMPLFIGDLIADTTHLSRADFGSYVLLICFYWRRGEPLPNDDRALSAAARVTPDEWEAIRPVMAEFFQIADGIWQHKRIDEELAEARKRYEGNRLGAEITNARRRKKETLSDAPGTPVGGVQSHSHSHSHSLERAPNNLERPTLEEVLYHAQRNGLAPWKATDWFQEMEGGGWLDHNHRPIVNWRAVLDRVRTKWEADGRPMQPPTQVPRHHNKPNPCNAGMAANPGIGQAIAEKVAKMQSRK